MERDPSKLPEDVPEQLDLFEEDNYDELDFNDLQSLDEDADLEDGDYDGVHPLVEDTEGYSTKDYDDETGEGDRPW
jgi:hypothetical protein